MVVIPHANGDRPLGYGHHISLSARKRYLNLRKLLSLRESAYNAGDPQFNS